MADSVEIMPEIEDGLLTWEGPSQLVDIRFPAPTFAIFRGIAGEHIDSGDMVQMDSNGLVVKWKP